MMEEWAICILSFYEIKKFQLLFYRLFWYLISSFYNKFSSNFLFHKFLPINNYIVDIKK